MIRWPAAVLAFAIAASASAAEYASVGTAGTILYDGPSPSARKLFIAPKGMPIELLSVIRLWVKIRDAAGDVLWIERDHISQERTVVAMTATLVRAHANDASAIVFQAEPGLLLDLVDARPAPGWVRVRHRDGSTGFVRTHDVWGV